MIRNLKALGLALVAVFAMSAIAASAAQAVTAEFSYEAGTTEVKAENDPNDATHIQKFTTTAGAFTCNSVAGEATTFNKSEVTGFNVEYWDTSKGSKAEHKCIGPLGTTTTIESAGCHFKFTPGNTVGEKAAGKSGGTVDLVDTDAAPCIKVKGVGCTIEIKAQEGINGVTYTTVAGTPEKVTISANASNIISNHTGATCGTGEDTKGTYTGTVTVRGGAGGVLNKSVTVT